MLRFIIGTGSAVGYQIPFCKVLWYLRLTVNRDGITKLNDTVAGHTALTPCTNMACCNPNHVSVQWLKISHTFHIL
jgi:hypothetical protein